jgi:hypothetical protein
MVSIPRIDHLSPSSNHNIYPHKQQSATILISMSVMSLLELDLVCDSLSCPLRVECENSSDDLVSKFSGIKLLKCGKCKSVRYCCRDCQKKDWRSGHKDKCAIIVNQAEEMLKHTPGGYRVGHTVDRLLPLQPALASEPYTPLPLQTLGAQVISGGKKVKRMIGSLSIEAKKTWDLVAIMGALQTMLSDRYDRLEKGLPPRLPDFVYRYSVDMIVDGTAEENCEIWHEYATKIKSWFNRASKAGHVFEFQDLDQSYIPFIVSCLQMFQSWEPVEDNNWDMHEEATVMCGLFAALSNQVFYLKHILCSTSPMFVFVDILVQWVDWPGPDSHLWNKCMEMMLSGLINGIDIAATVYDTPLHGVAAEAAGTAVAIEKLRTVIPLAIKHISNRKFQPYDYQEIDEAGPPNPMNIINHFLVYLSSSACRELSMVLRVKKLLFPDIDVSLLKPFARYYKKQAESYIRMCPPCRRMVMDSVRLFDSIIALC